MAQSLGVCVCYWKLNKKGGENAYSISLTLSDLGSSQICTHGNSVLISGILLYIAVYVRLFKKKKKKIASSSIKIWFKKNKKRETCNDSTLEYMHHWKCAATSQRIVTLYSRCSRYFLCSLPPCFLNSRDHFCISHPLPPNFSVGYFVEDDSSLPWIKEGAKTEEKKRTVMMQLIQ